MALRSHSDEDASAQTRPSFTGSIQEVGRGIMYAVVVLIVLGALYNTAIVAQPWTQSSPTDRVTNETHLGVAAGGQVQVDTDAAWYYDGEHGEAETVYNNSSGAVLTEGTDYQFYTNGTLENLQGSSADFDIDYSYYTLGPWESLFGTFADYGTTAFIMIGLGFIALGAAVALRYLGAFGGSSGGR